MNNITLTVNDYFSGLMENRASKIGSVLFSQLGNCIALFLTYCIIWYEKNGNTEYKTVINRLTEQSWWLVLVYYGIVQEIEIMRYVYAPLPWALCQFTVFSKLFGTMYCILLLDIIVITRYLFIFWIKNPASLNDDILGVFLTMWALMVSFIAQFVHAMMPGKEFAGVWFCSGLDPNSSVEQKYKSEFGYIVFKALSLVLHLAIGFRIKLYKWEIGKQTNKQDPKSKVTWLFHMGKNSIISVSESFIPGIAVAISVLPKPPRAYLDLNTFNSYPACLHEYYYTLIRPVSVILVVSISKIISDKYLQIYVWREAKDMWHSWKEKCSL